MQKQEAKNRLEKLKNLEGLNLAMNNISFDKRMMAVIAGLPKLKELNIQDNRLKFVVKDGIKVPVKKELVPWFDYLRTRLGNNFIY